MQQQKIEKEVSQEVVEVGVLASGEKVYDRVGGHIHENVRVNLQKALSKVTALDRKSIQETVTVEGPPMKSNKVSIDPEKDKLDLFLARRTSRLGLSTFVRNRSPEETNSIVVILSKNDGRFGKSDGYTVITAYPGDLSPREPWDPYFSKSASPEERQNKEREKKEAFTYWTHHAFVPDEVEFPIDEGTEQEYVPNKLEYPFLTTQEKEKQIIYTGLFVTDTNQLLELFPPKHTKVFAHHSTIEFMPKNTHGIHIGESRKLKIVGRASDEKGDALLVENPESQQLYPHITLSCADGVSPIYSNQLLQRAAQNNQVEYFSEPVYIEVVEGYENGNKKVITTDEYIVSGK